MSRKANTFVKQSQKRTFRTSESVNAEIKDKSR